MFRVSVTIVGSHSLLKVRYHKAFDTKYVKFIDFKLIQHKFLVLDNLRDFRRRGKYMLDYDGFLTEIIPIN